MRLLSALRRARSDGDGWLADQLEPGERVLASARLVDDGQAVATDRALLLRGSGAAPGAATRRTPWHRVSAATWDAPSDTLTVSEVTGPSTPAVHHRLRLAAPSLLPETVRERVQASIVVSQHVPLRGRRGARIVARRALAATDASATGARLGAPANELAWQLIFDAGLDPADAALRAKAERALTELREQTGL